MANAVYQKYKQSLLNGDANCDLVQSTANVAPYLALVSASYTFSASHQFYSSLAGVVGTDQQITTPTVTNGTFDGDDCTFTAVTGSAVTQLVFYRKNAGANTTWRLVLFEDTSVTGLPVTPNGGNIVVTFNASGIFTLSDRRAKENLVPVGKIGCLQVYEYNYAGSRERLRGLVAQEVAALDRGAVVEVDFRGRRRLAVDYARAIDALELAA